MIADLDLTIRQLLTNELAEVANDAVDVAFDQPNDEWSGRLSKPTLNCFLYDIRENATLRQHQWQQPPRGRNGTDDLMIQLRRTPLRIDCFYMITAWVADHPQDEHLLLANCLMALARYPILNPEFSDDGTEPVMAGRQLAQSGSTASYQRRPCVMGQLRDQPYEIPTRLAHHDLMTNPAEIWGSMENKMRPALSYVVTLPIDPWRKMVQLAYETRVLALAVGPTEPIPQDIES